MSGSLVVVGTGPGKAELMTPATLAALTHGKRLALADKDFRYLTKTYLPRKLKQEDWLD